MEVVETAIFDGISGIDRKSGFALWAMSLS